jgi:insulysin
MEIPSTHLTVTAEDSSAPRAYHTVQLGGALRCCLISDPSTDKAAASLCVGAGQLHDPAHGEGLAHLTEHMLFMGSTTFPIENEYDSYIQQQCGGHTNAYTDLECTCYYFDVVASSSAKGDTSGDFTTTKLYGALHRLFCAVSEPLIAPSSLERELQAIDSEHAKNITQDHWRVHQLSRSIFGVSPNVGEGEPEAPKHHPYANFGTGNKASLLEQASSSSSDPYQTLREGILRFFHRHYSLSNMTLAVIGQESVAELQAMVEHVLARIPKIPAARVAPIPPLSPRPDVTVVEWVPLRGGDCYPLQLQWLLPLPLVQHYRTKPGRYFSHLLGHEGPGSLLAVLRDRQWAQELSADDVSTNTQSSSIFNLSLELTEEGLEHVGEVLQMIFYYIEAVLSEIPRWVHDELQVMGDTTFQFLSKQDAAHTVSTMACNMHLYDPVHYLSGPYKIWDYDAPAVAAIGNALLSRSNLLVLLGSTTFVGTTDQKDLWYGTQYRIVPASEVENPIWKQFQQRQGMDATLQEVCSQLRLPDLNDMLPTEFTLLKSLEASKVLWEGPFADAVHSPPRCLRDTPVCRLWYKADGAYQTPKVNVLCSIRAPVLTPSLSVAVLSGLWSEIASELCNEFAYAASMAGLHCAFQESSHGSIDITIAGYHHKCGILIQRICDTLRTALPAALTTEPSPNQFFERMRSKLEQQYESLLAAQPYQHGSMITELVLDPSNSGSIQERLAYVRNKALVTSTDMLQFSNQLLSCFHLEVLVHGNVLPQKAVEWTQIILDAFQPMEAKHLSVSRGVQLPSSKNSIYRTKGWNEHDENSCVVNLYQVGLVDIPTNAILSLLLQLLREPAFNVLRTEEQLGYIVFSSVKTIANNVKCLMFLIQSDSFDPIHVDQRIEQFLQHFRSKIIMEMSDEDFQHNVASLCDSMLEKCKNLSEESTKHWNMIKNRSYHFSRLQDIAQAIRPLKKFDVLRFFDRYLLAPSPHRSKLSIQLFGTAHESLRSEEHQSTVPMDDIVIDDLEEFIHLQGLYPAQTSGFKVESMAWSP